MNKYHPSDNSDICVTVPRGAARARGTRGAGRRVRGKARALGGVIPIHLRFSSCCRRIRSALRSSIKLYSLFVDATYMW